MRYGSILGACGVILVGAALASPPAAAQTRSATVRVSAQVVDVASLASVPFPGEAAVEATAPAAEAGPAGRVFSVIPPRHTAVSVSVHVRGAARRGWDGMTLRVCHPATTTAPCRHVPLADSLGGGEAAAVTQETVLLGLLGPAEAVDDTAVVTLTLAYPGN
jgi:hypothetical protein